MQSCGLAASVIHFTLPQIALGKQFIKNNRNKKAPAGWTAES
jgi:hypothetical protein